ncbi:energy-coupling factor ABC transporter ATP-binding protein [Methanobrevibacter smithii]|jgi:putative cobalt import ATP-binding protein cbiO|uniref:energy-coupling factor ABC transporter ATP-binding protein n=1 Tax=Methanobrevibacter smithii TaxID=2173 RepID=UPI00037EDDB1|nr:ATP-binding cassette domain-containing protein [Methanobrevibacter smithii]MBS6828051.1 ATP-binding cassette domain-containing protein [Methanobrevibacter smithii]MBT9657983.1 ATP-binding cassette domain-containing protein [Methanobrevibacter smithii]MEE0720049.1 ATP-binding cassette domain-containing protein [Methanobrevibacter smithii]BDF80215.1 cobalt ABC transporter ATP-binding protein [Methanobrevibacter smithii]BDF81477.1 cobalt ABC transporter ATP-binding protein [Methanobrevibacter 
MTNIQLSTENLSFTYPDGTQALKNINIEIEKGEKVAIIGPNGAGKSTLFSHFNGLTEPTSGCVKIEDKPISFEKDELLKVRQKVGIVFQDPNDQLFAPTVKEDIAFGPMNLGLSYDEVEKRVEDALKMVGMENYEDKTPHHLSGGQQKRIAIAGIIAMKPELMILDEPTAGLDPDGVEKVLNIMNQLNEEGMTLIISSHDIDMISKYADKIFVLYNGEIIESGNKNKIFSDMELLKKAHLRTPITTEILYNLKESGLNVNTEKISVKDTCAEIIKAKQINE